MKIAVAGTGYVGLVAGVCFAEKGYNVMCVDIDEAKVALMRQGVSPIYEQGLEELMQKNNARGTLHFTTDYVEAYRDADAIFIGAPDVTREELNRLSLNILQATRHRISKTEFISCPGCGRTLYDLQSTLKEIKAATSHLKGLKIGVMGCIVNGPGEMADADYGYVGAGPGHISLYKGKECVVKNIPASEALPRLIALIKEHGDWVEP